MYSFLQFFTDIKEATFDFGAIGIYATDLYNSLVQNPDVVSIRNMIMGLLTPVVFALPYILIALMAVVSLFGKKILSLLKFIAFFNVGFVVGILFVAPILASVVAIPGWLCGVTLGFIAAIIHRFLYAVFYGVAVTYSVYVLCYTRLESGFSFSGYMLDRSVVALIVAVIALCFALAFKKYIEMLGTAALGGYLSSVIIRKLIYDYSAIGGLTEKAFAITLAIVLLFTLVGFYFQYKTRKRY